MKFRYLVVFLETGEAPTGTDDHQLAQQIADQEDQAWVMDTEAGTVLNDSGDEEEIEQINADDWEDPEQTEADGD